MRQLYTRIGDSGREYSLQKVLKEHHTRDPDLSTRLALCDETQYVLKPVSTSILQYLQVFRTEFEDDTRLRIPVDKIEDESIVVYEYLKTDLHTLIENYDPIPLATKKKILLEIGNALAALHGKNWIHLDVRPTKIFLDWYMDDNDDIQVEKVVLGDMDCAFNLEEDGRFVNYKIGNVMWRSPEGQLGRGIGKPSEVFSFALLCLYVLTGVQILRFSSAELSDKSEEVVLSKLLSFFGPLPDALVEHVDDAEAAQLLMDLWQKVQDNNMQREFADWDEDEYPNLTAGAKRLILSMANLDPAERATMSDIVQDSYWDEE